MKYYWGDLHNHCAASYGQGTPAQALANARQHLDFCALTGHAFWPDMPMDLVEQNGIIAMHLGGFAKLRHFWPQLLEEVKRANCPGRFVALPSYEWHSMEFGDYNCYAPRFDLELVDGPDLASLATRIATQQKEFFLLPHHCGYAPGFRGTNWGSFDGAVSPLVEIYSNHGCGEADDAPYDYCHSMGPRTGESLVRQGLLRGHRFGFYASTDSHDGYPGHYGHGKVGVQAKRLDLASVWQSLRARRTVASTGARISVTVDAGDGGIGEVVARKTRRDLTFEVEGSAPIELAELIEGGAGAWRVRRLPVDSLAPARTGGRFKIKLEAGWGRGGRTTDWKIAGSLTRCRLRNVEACFRFSAPQGRSAESTEAVEFDSRGRFQWQARSVPNPAGGMGGTHFNAGGTQAIVLDVEADAAARIKLAGNGIVLDLRLSSLMQGSHARPIGGFGSPALKVHRAIPEREFTWRLTLPRYTPLAREGGFAYLRVRQTDGHVAWASPIWFA